MSNYIEWQDGRLHFELHFDAPTIAPEQEVILFRQALLKIDAAVKLKTFAIEQRTDPRIYDYIFELKDGRKWDQVIAFGSATDTNPHMTFDVPLPGWRLSEFKPHRALRDLVILWATKNKLTKAEATFA